MSRGAANAPSAPLPTGAAARRDADHLTPYALALPAALLFGLLVLLPLGLTAALSFQQYSAELGLQNRFSLASYAQVLGDSYYLEIFWRTGWVAALVTLLCMLIGAPEAVILSRMQPPWRSICLLVILAPLLVSVVVRAFGWSLVLGPGGFVNRLFEWVGIGRQKMLYSPVAVVIALVHVMLPFMVIPVWTSLHRLDPQVENAALSLGASPATVLRRILLPQITPGLLSGGLIVFALSASALAIPGLLGGRRLKMVATLIYDEYLHALNWPLGAALALVLLGINLAVMLSYNAVLEGGYKKRLG